MKLIWQRYGYGFGSRFARREGVERIYAIKSFEADAVLYIGTGYADVLVYRFGLCGRKLGIEK
jgi:hypothetical protein